MLEGGTGLDVIVIGAGVMGAASAASLAHRGWSVLVLEGQRPGHERASSNGRVKGFRKAYFHDPRYVALARVAERGWRVLEAEQDRRILDLSGGLVVGRPDDPAVAAFGEALSRHDLPHERLTKGALGQRYPQLEVPRRSVGWLERGAGRIDTGAAIGALLERAKGHGARVVERARVVAFERRAGRWLVELVGGERHAARHLVLALGAWLPALLRGEGPLAAPRLAANLAVERQIPGWFAADEGHQGLPMFHLIASEDGGTWYGFGPSGDLGLGVLKLCRFHGGAQHATLEALDREAGDADTLALAAARRRWLPRCGPLFAARVCVNTLTSDGHFLVGPHPNASGVYIVGGFGGHGFKFAPAIGELLAEALVGGRVAPEGVHFHPGRWS